MADALAQPALVVFEDRREPFWLRPLRPGFRHCFCALASGPGWVIVDPLLHRLHVEALELPTDFGLAEAFAAVPGRTVLRGAATRPAKRAPAWPRPLTCVEIVKRAIGLEAPGALTPRALHRRLLALGWTPVHRA